MVVNEAISDQQIVTGLDDMPDKTIEPHLQTRKTQLEIWKHTVQPDQENWDMYILKENARGRC